MKDQMGDTGTKISGFMATLDSSTSPIDFSIAKQSGDKVSLTNRGEPLALISDCHSFDSCSILAWLYLAAPYFLNKNMKTHVTLEDHLTSIT
jgi:hypothetical protein